MTDSLPTSAQPRRSKPAALPEVAGAQLLARALNVLFYLRDAEPHVTTVGLAKDLGLPTSNVYRLIQQLELSGFVERRGGGEIVLGLRFLDLSQAVQARINREITSEVLPIMQRLTFATDESTLLTMPSGLQAVGLLTVDSTRVFRLSYQPGRALPMYRGASGRILLAHARPRVIKQVLADMKPYLDAAGRRVTPKTLRTMLDEIRADGFCITHSELDAGAVAVAVPITMPSGQLVAGLTLAGPAERMKDNRLEALVLQLQSSAVLIGQRLSATGQ